MSARRTATKAKRSSAAKATRRAGCSSCDADLAHCHGILIIHPDESVECLDDPQCDVADELHEDIRTCDLLSPSCGCA